MYTHEVCVPHVLDCPASIGNCVYTRGLCPSCFGLSSKHRKLCIHTRSVSLMFWTVQQASETVYTHEVCVPHVLDCPASIGNCVYTRGLCPSCFGLSSKHWKLCIHTGSVSLMFWTVQQALETVYTHGVSVPHVSDCPASTGKCVYTRGLCPCETVRQAPENVYVHHVWVNIGQPIKHCKQCIHTGSVSLSDCPASTGKYKCTPCLGSYRTIYKAQKTVYTHGVSVSVRLSSKHWKMCMCTMSGLISDSL